jgi:hypothetical protein
MRFSRGQQRALGKAMKYRNSGLMSFLELIIMAVVVVFFALTANSCYTNLLYEIITGIGLLIFLFLLTRIRGKFFFILILAIILLVIYLYVKCPSTVKLALP